ncbi:MAG: ABC transporter ATP-binding protein, partial [Cutibacterium sp.]|nr:ABC transporter ATP-binding protein [Cutibacterium sp.]
MIRTVHRHWRPRLRWLPHIPKQTPPPFDVSLINVDEVHEGRAVVRQMSHDGKRWLLPGSIASALVSLVNIGVPMA